MEMTVWPKIFTKLERHTVETLKGENHRLLTKIIQIHLNENMVLFLNSPSK